MRAVFPDENQIMELVQFIPLLYRDGFDPIKKWCGGEERDGVFTMPWPEYEENVEKFLRVASQEHWCDYGYSPKEAKKMIEDKKLIESSGLDEIRTMLTYCVRGERFCDGHMGAMIREGKIGLILKRLNELSSKNA
ncbi:DUF6508 domain-containing protein [Rheinheimera pleomorphica]|uniref:DUF6508 domain-containing protein n=1 Tax=Rheinheimera pleomorphica TaxID=2703963 RepID=UPI001423461F|nr:DUF6508 domain-containing protein [Rheinheimera pleomorphica]